MVNWTNWIIEKSVISVMAISRLSIEIPVIIMGNSSKEVDTSLFFLYIEQESEYQNDQVKE